MVCVCDMYCISYTYCAYYGLRQLFFLLNGGRSMTTWTRSGGKWSKNAYFWSTFRVKNVCVEVGGGQKRTKLCPRSPWTTPMSFGYKVGGGKKKQNCFS